MRKSSQGITIVATMLCTFVLGFPMQSPADSDGHEREELEGAQDAQHQDWRNLQHERREMDEAVQEGNWREYQHERKEADQAADAVQRDHAQVEHERQELREQQRRHHHHHGNDD